MNILDAARKIRNNFNLPKMAKEAKKRDKVNINSISDPNVSIVLDAVFSWLINAQKFNKLGDDGYARDFSFINGWASSYPETTGYIIPTLIEAANKFEREDLKESAHKALDWLVSIQLDNGAFQGGKIDSSPVVPVTFNTGQILLGLAAGFDEFGDEYLEVTHKAAKWLCETMDDDGCWRDYPTPFAANGEKAYETHVAWGLMEATKATGEKKYLKFALKNIDWALTKQTKNGWFSHCCLEDPKAPLTHTIGYVLRGVLEAYLHSGQNKYLEAAKLTAKPLSELLLKDGFLAGRLDQNWQGTVDWSCLTGSVQISACLFILNNISPNEKFVQAARNANMFVRKTIKIVDTQDFSGGVQGSFPVDGGYGTFQQLNWAAKFYIDAQIMELDRI